MSEANIPWWDPIEPGYSSINATLWFHSDNGAVSYTASNGYDSIVIPRLGWIRLPSPFPADSTYGVLVNSTTAGQEISDSLRMYNRFVIAEPAFDLALISDPDRQVPDVGPLVSSMSFHYC